MFIYPFKTGEKLLTQKIEGLGMCNKKSAGFIQNSTPNIESKMFLYKLLDTISKPIFLKDERHIYLLVNSAFCKFLGCKRKEIIGKSEYDFLPPQTANLLWQEDDRVLNSGIASEKSEIFTDSTGRILNICTKKSIFYNSDGKKILVGEIQVSDITESKHVENELRKNKLLIEKIADSAPQILYIYDLNRGQNIYANRQISEVLGYNQEEIKQKGNQWVLETIHPEDLPNFLESANHCYHITDGEVIVAEFRQKNADGSWRWFHCRNVIFSRNADGLPEHIIGTAQDITERKSIEIALAESEAKLQAIITNTSDGILIVDRQGYVRFANPAAINLFGRPPEKLLNHELGVPIVVNENVELNIIHSSGKVAIGEMRLAETQWNGESAYVISLRDITKRRETEDALRESEEQFRTIFELAPIGIGITALDGQFIRVNKALCNSLGYTPEEMLSRKLTDLIHPDYLPASIASQNKILQGKIFHFQIETCYLDKNNKIVNAILQTTLVRDAKGNPLHCINQIVDITERKRVEEQLIYDAFHDALTGLPNRAFFKERLEYALKRAKRDKNYLFAVLFLDLDRFKIINDSLGHLVGDRMIVAIANQLQKILRSTDIIARFGGDEFTILLDGIKDIKEVTFVTERIGKIMRSPFKIDGYEVFTTASIGIALSSTGYEQASDILRDADIAVYRAKELGKARYEVFDKEMHARAIGMLQLENNLRKALEQQEFKLNYQPIISLQTGCLVGFEALVRWQHPLQGLIPPTEFIPLAEETGSIVLIGEWILQEACQQMHAWQNQFPHCSTLKISVNISGKQIKDLEFIDKIDRILRQTKLDSKNLKLEITESVLMENAEAATKMLLELRNRNIELSIDDFGTGYSSLSYLHKFPVNTLKIDRSFVSRMQPNDDNCEIVRAILTLAHTLRMDAIAEGIETLEQLQQLRLLGCEQGQGYYFSKPLDREAATSFIATAPQW